MSKNVLVVDDSPLMRRLISEIVESDPDLRVVDTAENGRVALQKVHEHQPDGVLLDIEMPELSGLDTLRRLRLRSPAKVVILSHLGHEGSRVRDEALRLGAAEVIDKPTAAVSSDLRRTRGQMILATLRRVLDLPAAQVDLEPLPREGALASASVLAVHMRGLGSLLERLETRELLARLDRELDAVETIVEKHDGVVETRLGGTIFAVFGVPRPGQDHAGQAVRAAGELVTGRADLGAVVVTGLVVAGELRGQYRVAGAPLEQAMLLQRAGEDYGAPLIVCASTLAALTPAPPARRLDVVALDPDGAPVELYELGASEDPGFLAAYARGLEQVEAGRFAAAARAFAAALELCPADRAAARLLSRCRGLTGGRDDGPA